MTDYRKLAERIVTRVRGSREHHHAHEWNRAASSVERILREDGEALVGRVIAELRREGYLDHPSIDGDDADLREEICSRVLGKGGERAQPSNAAGEVVDSSRPDTEHPTSALPAAPAYVGPGDEVLYYGRRYVVTRRSPCPEDGDHIMMIHEAPGFEQRAEASDLQTRDGRPVAGFREQEAPSNNPLIDFFGKPGNRDLYNAVSRYMDAEQRIAGLERERDEARKERDLWRRIFNFTETVMGTAFESPKDLVRLDDETIERAVDHVHAIATGRTLHSKPGITRDNVREMLQDLRNGNIKEGS